MKRLLLLFLLALPMVASAQTEIDGIYYYCWDSEAHVTYDNMKYSGAITIPASVTYNNKSYPVTSIEARAFSGCSNLTSVAIPNTIIRIGDFAFEGCKL